MLMEEGKQWLWAQKEPLLPTTRLKKQPSFSGFSDGVAYLRRWFQGPAAKPKNVAKTSHHGGTPYRLQKRSLSANSFVPVSFPAYLNSGSTQQNRTRQQPRRSSLLEGVENTLELMSTSKKQAQLALPKDVQQKLAHSSSTSHDSSHLPVPLVPLPKFKVPSTLYGYLDESSFKKGEAWYCLQSFL